MLSFSPSIATLRSGLPTLPADCLSVFSCVRMGAEGLVDRIPIDDGVNPAPPDIPKPRSSGSIYESTINPA